MKKRFFLIAGLCAAISTTAFCQKGTTSTQGKKTTQSTQVKKPSTAPHSTVNSINNRLDGKEGLPEFDRNGGKPFFDILREKEHTSSISPEALEARTISALLWAACGKTDAPESYTAMYTERQPCINLYLVNQEGIFKYDRNEHKLMMVKHGHFLPQIFSEDGEQGNAPMVLLYAYNPEEIEISPEADPQMKEVIAGINCGAIMQNVTLFCASEHLSCHPFALNNTSKENLMRHLREAHISILYAQTISKK